MPFHAIAQYLFRYRRPSAVAHLKFFEKFSGRESECGNSNLEKDSVADINKGRNEIWICTRKRNVRRTSEGASHIITVQTNAMSCFAG